MKILHETCLEYFRRRLSEGWKCVSLEGYNAVFLSPDGIRREIDLRNDIETLRPNGAGSETGIQSQYPDSGFHWDKVDEEIPDEAATRVFNNSGVLGWQRDLYALPAHSGSGTINKVTAFFRVYGVGGEFRASIRTHATTYDGDIKTSGISYITYSHEWANNPFTGSPWTWAEIDALEAGVGLWIPGPGVVANCTQVYVEVDYTYVPPPPPVTPEYQKTAVYGSVDQLQQTAAKNLKTSIEEAAIAVPSDIQARYNVRTQRTISSPAIDTDYFLPETGSIDLSNFIHSSWFAYAPTTATMVISACELQVSLDGGTTFRKASGYEIADADFVRDEWNSIDVPLMLAQARFRIRFGTAAPASAELVVIRKA